MKIDTNSFEGYADMTAEQKVAAFEAFEYEDNADKLAKYKNSIDKLTHENAELTKFKREHLNDDEKKAEADKALQDELEGYRKEKANRDLIDSLMETYEGMTKDTAKKIAETEDATARHKLLADYMKDYAKKQVEASQNGIPKPSGSHNHGDDDKYAIPTSKRTGGAIDMAQLSKFTKR